tara:strand:- start:1683 stop:1964 length:282 start_codon:yes stop_codon:yes gene_type:complete
MPPYNPPIAHYCQVSVKDLAEDMILRAIGKKGYFFKKITQDCGANYIWWNKEKEIIEIWGSFHSMAPTEHNIRQHIENVSNENYKYKFCKLIT